MKGDVMKTLLALSLVLLLATPALALQATYTYTLPTDASRTGVRIERRDGADTAPWVAQGAVLAAGATSFNQPGIALSVRYCYRAVTVNAFGDGDPNTPSCGTADKPMSAGTGTLLIAP